LKHNMKGYASADQLAYHILWVWKKNWCQWQKELNYSILKINWSNTYFNRFGSVFFLK
jgi:hypothetical protein